MSSLGRRNNYPAVTITVCALVVVSVISQCSRDMIPPGESNELEAYSAEFINRAARQNVKWRTTEMDPFAEARRLDKPLLIYVGRSWSQGASRFDAAIFGSREIAARINRDFVAVRVDLVSQPEWRGALLPLTRAELQIDPGFTIWFLKPDGEIISWLNRRSWSQKDEPTDFLDTVSAVMQLWNSNSSEPSDVELEQRKEENALTGNIGVQAVPNMDLFVESVLILDNFETLKPTQYLALLQAGEVQRAEELLLPELNSLRTDLVDGGFFWLAPGAIQNQVEFGKLATDQAQMAVVLAHMWRATGESVFLYHCQRALQSVMNQFLIDESWPSFISVQAEKNGRSDRHSFGMSKLRLEFDQDQRNWSENVGLNSSENPQMVPYIVDNSTITAQKEELDEFIRKLQSVGSQDVLFPGGFDHLDSSGTTLARSIEAARLLNDDQLLKTFLAKVNDIERYRSGLDEVRHSLNPGQGTDVWLGDFTAYADVMLEVYVSTGDASALADGKAVLERALLLFGTEDEAVYFAVTGNQHNMGSFDLNMPSIVEDGQPPALPALIRLAFRYGVITEDVRLIQIALKVSERYSQIANQFPTHFSSFISAAQEAMLTGFLIVVGEDSVARAKKISLDNPGTFVAPAVDSERESGLYKAIRLEFDLISD